MKKLSKIAAVPLLAAAALAACGGGDDGPPPVPQALTAVPDTASASSSGLVGYLGDLAAANEAGESVEPLSLDGYNPPLPEDTEPEPVT